MQFDGLPDPIINYDSRCKLPIDIANNCQKDDTHKINLCIIDEEHQNLIPYQKPLMHWHHRFGHKTTLQLSNYFVRNLLRDIYLNQQEDVNYLIVQYVNVLRLTRNLRDKMLTVDPITGESLKTGHLTPGSGVSVDHFASRLKGRTYTLFGKTTFDQYVGEFIFVDHISKCIYVKPQLGFSGSETNRTVLIFEKLCLDNRTLV